MSLSGNMKELSVSVRFVCDNPMLGFFLLRSRLRASRGTENNSENRTLKKTFFLMHSGVIILHELNVRITRFARIGFY